MQYLYLVCLLISLSMLFWLKIFDVRKSTTQFTTLVIIIISCLGFYFLATATNADEALVAHKLSYVGGTFLPAFYFFLVLEICHVELPWIIAVLTMLIPCINYGFVCSIGSNELFYKSYEFVTLNGIGAFKKVYGPVHAFHIFVMLSFLIASFAVAIYAMVKKKSVNRKNVLIMVILGGFAIASYIIEKTFNFDYEIVPLAYIVLIIGTLFPVYDYNLYTVYENKDIINEQLGKIGFLTFDCSKIYKGCNDYMMDVFPELSDYRVGQKICSCTPKLQEVINQITNLEAAYKGHNGEHIHIHLSPFSLDDKHYAGMIHVVTNIFGKLKGYTIELHDDTDHFNALTLQEHYAEELAEEVDEKTKRIRAIQQKTILGMAQMVESRDLSTGGHIKRTSDVVQIFASKLYKNNLGFNNHFLTLVIRSAPMHDLGKIGVDDAILRKQGRFTDEEYAQMKKHSEIGYKMVSEILSDVEEPDFVEVAKNVAHYHHEKVNGTGYPDGLKGDEIPVEARIMALADVFDALVSKRCYKEAFSYDKAFDIIKNDAGIHFDKTLAEVFLSCRPELEEYYNKN